MTTPRFCDISAFQPANIDWAAYRQWAAQWDGISRVAMRSSYGVGFIDQHFNAYRSGALAAGIDCIIFYHYGYPSYNAGFVEADWQYKVIGSVRPQDLVILDLEEGVPAATADWAYEWLARQEANYGGKLPGIYASSYYITQRLSDTRLARYPLWLANWQYTPDERPPVPPPWSSYEFVQYTDKATNIPGIPGDVDCNIFLGGATIMRLYGPGQGDFDQWFVANDDDHWTCKQTGATLQLGNLALYRQLSIDGNTLPVPGLPIESEQYHVDPDGYAWSSQKCERAQIVYDSEHKKDSQPGLGSSYLAHINYETIVAEKLPDAIRTSISTIADDVATLVKVAASIPQA